MTGRLRDRGRPRGSRSGFTLIELAVVITVLGVVSVIILANFIRFQNRARYSSCVSNQRHVAEAALLYSSLSNPGTVNVDVNVLTGGGWLVEEAAECPQSTVHAMNDYTIHFTANRVTQIDCKIQPAEHQWDVP
jgi:prepilin-type N-terminal cleavage/methylation domain-containing protein